MKHLYKIVFLISVILLFLFLHNFYHSTIDEGLAGSPIPTESEFMKTENIKNIASIYNGVADTADIVTRITSDDFSKLSHIMNNQEDTAQSNEVVLTSAKNLNIKDKMYYDVLYNDKRFCIPGPIDYPKIISDLRSKMVSEANMGKIRLNVEPFASLYNVINADHINYVVDTLYSNNSLIPGQSLISQNGKYTFIYQTDGNFCIYKNNAMPALWALNMSPQNIPWPMPAGKITLYQDGNLCAAGPDNKSFWCSSSTQWAGGKGPFKLVMQNNGNAVILDSTNAIIWQTNTGTGINIDTTDSDTTNGEPSSITAEPDLSYAKLQKIKRMNIAQCDYSDIIDNEEKYRTPGTYNNQCRVNLLRCLMLHDPKHNLNATNDSRTQCIKSIVYCGNVDYAKPLAYYNISTPQKENESKQYMQNSMKVDLTKHC
jgi:hypothetical protein